MLANSRVWPRTVLASEKIAEVVLFDLHLIEGKLICLKLSRHRPSRMRMFQKTADPARGPAGNQKTLCFFFMFFEILSSRLTKGLLRNYLADTAKRIAWWEAVQRHAHATGGIPECNEVPSPGESSRLTLGSPALVI